jgi:hypothetical protein
MKPTSKNAKKKAKQLLKASEKSTSPANAEAKGPAEDSVSTINDADSRSEETAEDVEENPGLAGGAAAAEEIFRFGDNPLRTPEDPMRQPLRQTGLSPDELSRLKAATAKFVTIFAAYANDSLTEPGKFIFDLTDGIETQSSLEPLPPRAEQLGEILRGNLSLDPHAIASAPSSFFEELKTLDFGADGILDAFHAVDKIIALRNMLDQRRMRDLVTAQKQMLADYRSGRAVASSKSPSGTPTAGGWGAPGASPDAPVPAAGWDAEPTGVSKTATRLSLSFDYADPKAYATRQVCGP